jgi:mevalonate kinase
MRAIAPGKLILSGEHAVVHGCPALVTAVSRHASAEVTPGQDARVQFVTPFGESVFSGEELRGHLVGAQVRYQDFLAGVRPIAEVVPSPLEFIALGWPLLESAPAGVRIELTSTIPLGSGMGSSAAVSVALLQALAGYAGQPLAADRCASLSLEMERFQHGRPSGVDSFVAAHGGMVRYVKDAPTVPLPILSPRLRLVHTGTPEATTGECVEQVRHRFAGSEIWTEFATVCGEVERALGQENPGGLIDAVRHNHRLLVALGVVPAPVAKWIAGIERAGGAAKICGAGSVRGPGGGMVWVIGDMSIDSRYTGLTVEGESHGVRIQE